MWTRHLLALLGALPAIAYGSALIFMPDDRRMHYTLAVVMTVVVALVLGIFLLMCGKFSRGPVRYVVVLAVVTIMCLSIYWHASSSNDDPAIDESLLRAVGGIAIVSALIGLLYMSEAARSSRECRAAYDRLNISLRNAPADAAAAIFRVSGLTKRQMKTMQRLL